MGLTQVVIGALARRAPHYDPRHYSKEKPAHHAWTLGTNLEWIVYNTVSEQLEITSFAAWFIGTADFPTTTQAVKDAAKIAIRYGPLVAALYFWEAAATNFEGWSQSALGDLVYKTGLYRLPFLPEKFLDWLV